MKQNEAAEFRRGLMALQRRLRREMNSGAVLTSEGLVLGAVERHGSAVSPGKLAAELVMTSSNVAASLRILERGGLLTRRRDPDDARRVVVDVTEAGRSAVVEDRRERDNWLRNAVNATLTAAEQQTLRQAGDLMKRLAHHGLDSN